MIYNRPTLSIVSVIINLGCQQENLNQVVDCVFDKYCMYMEFTSYIVSVLDFVIMHYFFNSKLAILE